ncbi:sugar kinase [Aurantimonas sp. Leaf443]|uniref:sugar kinase n=1 Tax=Aurantimonas sp. Leaf443 TaxID=1736378 RepID=UPI0006F7F957|nr:sugar kinase [Aurantimonas sp. Leaf443]KQT84060.1 2-dehydro-3-deoxygluconokinase [Aurantimonas sp. Leaf443]
MGGRILCIGECMVELKQAGQADLFGKGYAGDTFNAAYYARQFLPASRKVDYLTAVGTDLVSREMLAFMEGAGVGTGFVRTVEDRIPGLYMIHLEKGERSFSYWRSASAAKALADDPAHLARAVGASDTIVFSGITLAILAPDAVDRLLDALSGARDAGKLVVFDPNIRPRLWDGRARMLETISRGARAATLLMPSFDDETRHFGDASIAETIARYRGLGVAHVVVKDGEKGVTLAFEGKETRFVPAAPVARVVDTTSAGDSFNGAFLARYGEGEAPEAAAAFAANVAARVIQHHGALVPRESLVDAA